MEKYQIFNSEFKELTGRKMCTGLLEERIVSQKIAYLLHKRGVGQTYHGFKWYLHGVFSFDLWEDTIHKPDIRGTLDDEQVERILSFKKECSDAGITKYFNTSRNLELITTILYFADSQEALHGRNDELVSRVKRAKNKFLDDEEIKEAIARLSGIQWNFS